MRTVTDAALENANEVKMMSLHDREFLAFTKGVEFAQRWIPIGEELPPLNEYVLFKYSEGEHCVGCLNVYGYYCSPYMPKENDYASIHLLSEVTHWRHIEVK